MKGQHEITVIRGERRCRKCGQADRRGITATCPQLQHVWLAHLYDSAKKAPVAVRVAP